MMRPFCEASSCASPADFHRREEGRIVYACIRHVGCSALAWYALGIRDDAGDRRVTDTAHDAA
jgi:hypothetical protein